MRRLVAFLRELLTRRESFPAEFRDPPEVQRVLFDPIEEIWAHRLRHLADGCRWKLLPALALLGTVATAAAAQTVVPTGGYEIRDNAGRTIGYVVEDPAIGGFDVRDAAGRAKGFLIPDDAVGGRRFEPQPAKRK